MQNESLIIFYANGMENSSQATSDCSTDSASLGGEVLLLCVRRHSTLQRTLAITMQFAIATKWNHNIVFPTVNSYSKQAKRADSALLCTALVCVRVCVNCSLLRHVNHFLGTFNTKHRLTPRKKRERERNENNETAKQQ